MERAIFARTHIHSELMSKHPAGAWRRSVLFAVIAFVLIAAAVSFIAFQRYTIKRDNKQLALQQELYQVHDRLLTMMYHNLSSVNTLAAIYKLNGEIKDFDSVAAALFSLNKYIDIVQFSEGYVIKDVYPKEGNTAIIGRSIHEDSLRQAEAVIALADKNILFAGPYELIQSPEKAIVGRVPVFSGGTFKGFSLAVTKLSTIARCLDEPGRHKQFTYWLSKVNVLKGKTEYFFDTSHVNAEAVSIYMPSGNWTLHVSPVTPAGLDTEIAVIMLLGILLAAIVAVLIYIQLSSSAHLSRVIDDKTWELTERVKELSTLHFVNEAIRDPESSLAEALQKVAEHIPSGWQYPGVCAARIHIDGVDYHSANYAQGISSLLADFTISDGRKGFIEVVYLEPVKEVHGAVFLKEEVTLVNSIAATIAIYIGKKSQQEALQRSEANLKTIFENTDVGFLLLDAGYIVRSFNNVMQNGYAEFTGITLVVGQNFVEAVVKEKQRQFRLRLAEAVLSKTKMEYETVYTQKEEQRCFQVSIIPIWSGESLLGICIAAYDITGRKQMEQERQKIIETLRLRNLALENFAHGLSHNVRAPLATILGLCQILRTNHSEEENQIALNGIYESAEQLDKKISELNFVLSGKQL